MEINNLAQKIFDYVGGKSNINNVTHCATRLRISVLHTDKVEINRLDSLSNVLKVVLAGNQVQVVIGDTVNKVYKEFIQLTGEEFDHVENKEESGSLFTRFFDLLSGSLTPLIPVFAGAGMLKAMLILLQTFHLISDNMGFYKVISAAGNAVFYFFPIMLGFTVAQKLKVNPFVGATIGAALLEPNFTVMVTEGVGVNFLGIPLIPMDYSGSMLPVFVAILVYSYIERFLQKYIPSSVQIFLVPMLSLGIMVPFTALVFGPFGLYISELVGNAINAIIGFNSVLAGGVISGLWLFIVSLGLHWALMPIAIQNLNLYGSDQILAMAAGCVFASLGIAIGVFLKTKDKELKTFAMSSALGQLIAGVGEPVMYGIIFRYKRLLPIILISGGISGALIGRLDIKLVAFTAFTNIFTIASYSPVLKMLVVWVVTVIITATLVVTFGYEDKDINDGKSEKKEEISTGNRDEVETIGAPLSGKVQKLHTLDDEIFSSGVMGKGVAIVPTENKIFAPFDGEVIMITETKHAIGLKSDSGIELLIHVGVDTFKMNGEGFSLNVKKNQRIYKGNLMLTFDKSAIVAKGLDPAVIIVITNSSNYDTISDNQLKSNVEINDSLLFLSRGE
ncbi:hypothetical protein B6S41_01640 [Enterococcus faecalis]|uniref:glucose PTS transporter subunit IIA n=1 Tax=Enterococcus faecalis TaxID=1351 RepID=UPI000A19C016|nr:glucose PTS transporter subunit IIA [Enterococcus faecalis]OSM25636.1 hypothetical protein B6S39_00615 [Enterococcus faecalis]OSM28835.1 hypothetical protein B6S41_01640 [Enterococcus faecalis]WPH48008.1 glucose PTS transporter subunit IIA [Enterococcus faecalis]